MTRNRIGMINSSGNFKFNRSTNRAAFTVIVQAQDYETHFIHVSYCQPTNSTSTSCSSAVQFNNDFNNLFSIKIGQPELPTISIPTKPVEEKKPEKPVEPPKPAVYAVVDGDNLTKIGTAHNVEWQRLWAKNTQLTHPDKLNVGDQITIPLADEVLQRDIPVAVALPAVTPGIQKPVSAPAAASYDGSNTYDYGYCTWYVKNRRGASLPNMLGNANMWYWNAQRTGLSTGSEPAAGAVGTTTRGALGHVVYVESVNGDGTIQISEMNAPTWGAVTYRKALASEFVYIY